VSLVVMVIIQRLLICSDRWWYWIIKWCLRSPITCGQFQLKLSIVIGVVCLCSSHIWLGDNHGNSGGIVQNDICVCYYSVSDQTWM